MVSDVMSELKDATTDRVSPDRYKYMHMCLKRRIRNKFTFSLLAVVPLFQFKVFFTIRYNPEVKTHYKIAPLD